jgi:NhaA family Na+:H+ antiporter
MIVPAAIYAWLNWGDDVALDGWAIPVATDIAFALAVLSVFGSRVPIALKVFLLTLAIFDDLAAIVIIALFYSGDLSLTALLTGAVALTIAVAMNRMGATRTSSYVLLGLVLWIAVLKSGVHATLAGVLIAFCIPLRDKGGSSPLRDLETDLHGPVSPLMMWYTLSPWVSWPDCCSENHSGYCRSSDWPWRYDLPGCQRTSIGVSCSAWPSPAA